MGFKLGIGNNIFLAKTYKVRDILILESIKILFQKMAFIKIFKKFQFHATKWLLVGLGESSPSSASEITVNGNMTGE